MTMTIAVTGASGFVGSHVVAELLRRGHSVRGLVRNPRAALEVLAPDSRLTLVQGDVLAPGACAELLRGCQALVNCVGIIRESGGQTFKAMHADAVRNLVTAARAAGASRVVQISALGVSDQGKTAYQRTKWEGEQIVRRSGLRWTILRPSMIHGVGSEFLAMAAEWASGQTPPYLFMPYFQRVEDDTTIPIGPLNTFDPVVQPVAVEDVAYAAAESLVRIQAVGEIYNLVGSQTISWPDLLRTVRDCVPGSSTSVQPWGIPGVAAAAVARVASWVGLGRFLPFDEGMAILGSSDSTASPAKAKADLGLDPRPFRESFKAYASRV